MKIGINTIGAWRSELNAVRQVVTDRLSSALILGILNWCWIDCGTKLIENSIEDDADWDVALKNQLLDIARGSRFLSNQTDATSHSPYGDGWDVLWLGHCGMGPHADDRRRFIIHQDPTAPAESRIRTIAGRPEAKEWAQSGKRIVFTGHGSCSVSWDVWRINSSGRWYWLYDLAVGLCRQQHRCT